MPHAAPPEPIASARESRALMLWPLLLAVAAFFALGGGGILAPSRVGWLGHGDLAQSYLGWAFFRDTAWQWPPGANPHYGLEIASSVYYSDSIPLMALGFKALAPWLPAPFQYFGLWFLACLLLQAWFAWKLASLATRDVWVRSAAVLLLLAAPPMLNRLGGHMALVAHWPLLAGLYLCLRPQRAHQLRWWALLIACAMAIHAYLFVMAGVLWTADLLRRYREDSDVPLRPRRLGALREAVAVVGAALVSAWLSGLFAVSGKGMSATGYSYYKMNLLAPFDGAGWSAFGLRVATAAGEYEGFNYLGVGGIALAVVALTVWVTRGRRHWNDRARVLAAMAALLTLAAITHAVGIGAAQWALPLPEALVGALRKLPVQATGRLFWVVYYLVWVAGVFAIARWLPSRAARVALLGVLVLQCVDLAPGLAHVREQNLARAQMSAPDEYASAFWSEAAGHYGQLRRMPTRLAGPGWEAAAFMAKRHGMATEIVQVARVDVRPFWALDQRKRERLFAAAPDPGALYLLEGGMVDLARAALVHPDDALFRLDGQVVLAPRWARALPSGAQNLRSGNAVQDAGPYRLPFRADLSKGQQARSLLSADGERIDAAGTKVPMATAALYLPTGGDPTATLDANFVLRDLTPVPTRARLDVRLDGRTLAQVVPDAQGRYLASVRVPPAREAAHFRRIELHFGVAPASAREARKQKLGLDALDVSRAP